MTHTAWLIEMKAALASSDRKPRQAVGHLRRLAQKAARVERESITTWHIVEALGAAAFILSERRQHRQATAIFRAIIRRHARQLAYHGNGIASAFALAALEAFAAGNRKQGARLVRQSIRWRGQFPNPDELLERAMQELRAHEQRRAKHRVASLCNREHR